MTAQFNAFLNDLFNKPNRSVLSDVKVLTSVNREVCMQRFFFSLKRNL